MSDPTSIPELSVDVKIPTVILVQDVNTTGTIPVIGFGGVGSLSYVITPTLPNGLIFQNSNGTIVGRPNVPLAKTTYTVTVVDKVPQTKKATFDLIVANSQVKLDPVEWLPDSYQDNLTMSKTYGYFIITDNVSYKNFIVKIVDRDKVALARSVINGEAPLLRIEGNLTTGTATYNPSWSYHVDPVSIEFYFVGPKSCRFPFDNIESNVADLSSYVTPGPICNWQLIAETTTVEDSYQRSHRQWNPNNQSHGIYINGESVVKTPTEFTQFYFVSGTMPGNLTIDTGGNISGNVENLYPSLTDSICEYQFTLAMCNNDVANLTTAMISIASDASVTLGSNVPNVFSETTNLSSLVASQGNIQILTYGASVITGRPYYRPNHGLSDVINF